MGNKNIVLLVY